MTSPPLSSIAFLCHPYHRGGVTSWMIDAAKECVSRNIETYFVTVKPRKEFISGKNRPNMVSLLNMIKHLHLIAPEAGITFEFGTIDYKALVYANSILKFVPAGVPIIISDDPSIWKGACSLALRNPIIGVLHSDETPYFNLAKQYSSSISKFVTVSTRIANKCENFPELRNLKFHTIPCGVVLPKFHPHNISSEFLSLVWIGRIEENQKRVSDLPKIAVLLKKYGVKFQLSIIGHGPQTNYLEEQIGYLNLTDCVQLYGWQDAAEINKRLSNSDFLILTSNFEGMSVAAMEALANGCGIISSKVSGVEDLESDSDAKNCLWLFPIGDVEGAVKCIIKAKETPVTQRKNAARNLAEKKFSIKVCMDQYISIIRSSDNLKQKLQARLSDKLGIFLKSSFISRLRYLKLKLHIK